MCRLAAYMGPEITISSLVTEPKHSLIHQSYHARERVEPLNGDGFGIGWYAPDLSERPALFKEVSPAWSNQNLRCVSRVTRSGCIFAHVRAATIGGELSRVNCHPFTYKKYMFMHNGTVFGFEKIKRSLRIGLSDLAYENIRGGTDTEHIFALFLDSIVECQAPGREDVIRSLQYAIARVEKLKQQHGIVTPSTMNLVLSDGARLLATRYVSEGDESNSLYYSQLSNYGCESGSCNLNEGEGALLVVSEPLEKSSAWTKVENNHMVLYDKISGLEMRPIVLPEV